MKFMSTIGNRNTVFYKCVHRADLLSVILAADGVSIFLIADAVYVVEAGGGSPA
jgi:hypothetical protein